MDVIIMQLMFFPTCVGLKKVLKHCFFASPHRALGIDVTIYVPHSYIVANWFVVLGKKFKI